MKTVFVDTSAWYALADKADPAHKRAMGWMNDNTYPLLTTNYVFFETINLLISRNRQKEAVEFGDRLQQSRSIIVQRTSGGEDRTAWELFIKYTDKRFSLVDCSSFVIMKKHKINEAFTFDKHFSQMGFTAVPGF